MFTSVIIIPISLLLIVILCIDNCFYNCIGKFTDIFKKRKIIPAQGISFIQRGNLVLRNGSKDKISEKILFQLAGAGEPLETKELELLLLPTTRVKILYRLNRLRGDGLLKGKPVGSGKGAWIWWDANTFVLKRDFKK